MIDPKNDTVQQFVSRGFHLAFHAYLRPDGDVKVSYCAKNHDTGQMVQGWSKSGSPDEALKDLARHAGLSAS